jgi:hypothetical protein
MVSSSWQLNKFLSKKFSCHFFFFFPFFLPLFLSYYLFFVLKYSFLSFYVKKGLFFVYIEMFYDVLYCNKDNEILFEVICIT